MDIFWNGLALLMVFAPMIFVVVVIARFGKLSKQRPARKYTQPDPNIWQTPAQRGAPRQVKSLKPASSGQYDARPDQKFLLGKSGSSLRSEGHSSLAETFMKDDREHDWLARQMREEARILRRSDLLDLGAAHDVSCDADMLKKYHLYAEHDDSIDNGEF